MQLVAILFLALAEKWTPLAPCDKSRNLDVQILITDSYILIWNDSVIKIFILSLINPTMILSPVNRFGF